MTSIKRIIQSGRAIKARLSYGDCGGEGDDRDAELKRQRYVASRRHYRKSDNGRRVHWRIVHDPCPDRLSDDLRLNKEELHSMLRFEALLPGTILATSTGRKQRVIEYKNGKRQLRLEKT